VTLTAELVACGAVRFGSFTLTSGRQSPYYVDVKQATSRPRVLRLIAKEMAAKAKGYDVVAGVELGAVPILVAVGLEADLPMAIVRKGERTHGTGKRIEGSDVANKRVFLVEDVTTTGKSVLEGLRVLREAGANVDKVCSVVDRAEGATDALAAQQCRLEALVSAKELLAMSAKGATH